MTTTSTPLPRSASDGNGASNLNKNLLVSNSQRLSLTATKELLQEEDAGDDDECDDPHRGLLLSQPQRWQKTGRTAAPDAPTEPSGDSEDLWRRPYWLGLGLFLTLFSFWLLDSLKDPLLGALTSSHLEQHLPRAKLFSVATTLCLVCFLEYVQHERKQKRKEQQQQQRTDEDVLDAAGVWSKMDLGSTSTRPSSNGLGLERRESNGFYEVTETNAENEDRVPSSIFAHVGLPYCLCFAFIAYLLQFNPAVAFTVNNRQFTTANSTPSTDLVDFWHVLGYFLYAAIESFGSISVATFWSYANSTLSLHDAERYYGPIIAMAQMGAIAGSTMVTMHIWNNITLMITACLIILLHILVMNGYSRKYEHLSSSPLPDRGSSSSPERPSRTIEEEAEPTLWSGVYLTLKYNYVLLILGVSCLYEVSLTCLNYQMTLLGWKRFEEQQNDLQDEPSSWSRSYGNKNKMSFTQFMGHYGQMVNLTSLVLSSVIFPRLIQQLGLRWTLRLFPTLLLVVNAVAFGAIPGNLTVLFLSLSFLKAMTYSIHDPAKELLYLPTSNPIKFQSKFWIDVVGARIAKAVGSSINSYAGTVDRSIRVASAPSLLTACALWYVCYRAGTQFDRLIATGQVVGLDDATADPRKSPTMSATALSPYSQVHVRDDEGGVIRDLGDTCVLDDEQIELSSSSSAMEMKAPL